MNTAVLLFAAWVVQQGHLSAPLGGDRWVLTSNEDESHFTYASMSAREPSTIPFSVKLDVTPLDAVGLVRTAELDLGDVTVILSLERGALGFLPLGGGGVMGPEQGRFVGTVHLEAHRDVSGLRVLFSDEVGHVARGEFACKSSASSLHVAFKSKGLDGRRFRVLVVGTPASTP